jgi:hypothetical protein
MVGVVTVQGKAQNIPNYPNRVLQINTFDTASVNQLVHEYDNSSHLCQKL